MSAVEGTQPGAAPFPEAATQQRQQQQQQQPAAASIKDREKQVHKTLSTLLRQLYELEAVLADYTQQPGSQELLAARLQAFSQGVGELRQQAAAFSHLQIPTTLLRFVDGGGHPDDFVRMMFRTAVADNQTAAGRVAALQAMHTELSAAAAAAFPAEAAAYESVVARKQAEQQAADAQ